MSSQIRLFCHLWDSDERENWRVTVRLLRKIGKKKFAKDNKKICMNYLRYVTYIHIYGRKLANVHFKKNLTFCSLSQTN